MLAENLFEKYKIDEDRFNGYFPSIGEFAAGLNNEIHPPRAAIFNLKTAALFLCLRARKERPVITKPREKTREELTAEMREGKKNIQQHKFINCRDFRQIDGSFQFPLKSLRSLKRWQRVPGIRHFL